MPVFLAAVLFVAGAALIIKSADIFVDAAGWTSDVTGISRVVIGATIVSFATTSPEYFVSLIAVLRGANDMAVGNAVGSMTANLGIAFALLAAFTSGEVKDKSYAVKGLFMAGSAAALLVFCLNGYVSAYEGAALLLIFILFTWTNIRGSRDREEKRERTRPGKKEIAVNMAKFIGGAGGVVFGSSLMVDNGRTLAAAMGISEAVIGLTFVAIGTSLPEIVTTVTAIIKKERALSIGNILGANTLNATLILATGAFVSPAGRLAVSPETIRVDLPAALLLMAVAVVPTAAGGRLYRRQGVALIGAYLAYAAYVLLWRG